MSIRNQLEEDLVNYIDDVLEKCNSRAAYVINFILKNGSITGDDLHAIYGHGARAVGDVRDNGIPIVTNRVKGNGNKTIAQYVFGSAKDIKKHKFGGRINFPKSLKPKLIERDGSTCKISLQDLAEEDLQVDHRVPFFISGDLKGKRNPDDFMLLSRSMQRAKSWDCEKCKNLLDNFDIEICKTCYWAYPENYSHVAMKDMRIIYVAWEDNEVTEYDRMESACKESGKTVQDYLKSIVTEKFSD